MGKEQRIALKRVHQYLLVGRAKPTEKDKEPKVYRMRMFAPNTVVAKSRFWSFMRKQKKIKHSCGELLAVHEVAFMLYRFRFKKSPADPLKSSAWLSDTNQERDTTICTRSTETLTCAELLARCVSYS